MPDNVPDHLQLEADPEECPARLDVYLADALPDFSRTRLQRLIRSGEVAVAGTPAKQSLVLVGGETIVLRVPPPAEALPAAEDIPLDVLHEDADLLVINKPAGTVVHPGAGVSSGTLVNALLHHCGSLSTVGGVSRPGIVHRLDRLTSGCIAVAKTDAAHRALSAQLADHSMGRTYLAWVVGEMPETEGRIEAAIGRSPRQRTRMAVMPRTGRDAATRWRVVGRGPGLSRLECVLETGRTHQIRVHLAHVHHPVVGDPEYGLSPREEKMRIPAGNPSIIQALSRCERQMLHAWRLRLVHPRTGATMEFEAPLPDDFAALDRALALQKG
jgi:23S rRNA pseudouridine1911/1915/1917 synthase